MATSGSGRGRGWLKIHKKENNAVAPEIAPITTSPTEQDPLERSKTLSVLQFLDINDDGILLNQKLKVLVNEFDEDCQTTEQAEKMCNFLHSKALHDSKLGISLVIFIRSLFNKSNYSDTLQFFRTIFVKCLQHDFENAKHLQSSDPEAFHNAIKMLSEFYSKSWSDGDQYKVFAKPLINYYGMLLETAEPEDLELLVVRLYFNGAAIMEKEPQDLKEMMIKLRKLLTVDDVYLTKKSKLWLLLAIDMENNNFKPLPKKLIEFYTENFEDNPFLKKLQNSINCVENKQNANVPQQINDSWEKMNLKATNNQLSTVDSSHKMKKGRPILGTGSRVMNDSETNDNVYGKFNKNNVRRNKQPHKPNKLKKDDGSDDS